MIDCSICKYEGPIQVVSCAEHNVAAKNLNKAQALLMTASMERDQCRDVLAKFVEAYGRLPAKEHDDKCPCRTCEVYEEAKKFVEKGFIHKVAG